MIRIAETLGAGRGSRGWTWGAGVIAALLLPLAPDAARAQAQLISGLAPLCMHVDWNRDQNGTRLVTYNCNADAGQQFRYDGSRGQIRVYGDKCLHVNGEQPGAQVVINTCWNGAPNHPIAMYQQWRFEGKRIINRRTNACIDIKGGWPWPGGEVIVWGCHDSPNQKWAALHFTQMSGRSTQGLSPAQASAILRAAAAAAGQAAKLAVAKALGAPMQVDARSMILSQAVLQGLTQVFPLTQVTPLVGNAGAGLANVTPLIHVTPLNNTSPLTVLEP